MVGFAKSEILGFPQHKAKGFQRPIQIFTKSTMFLSERVEATPSNITSSDPVYNDSEKYSKSPRYVPPGGRATEYEPQSSGPIAFTSAESAESPSYAIFVPAGSLYTLPSPSYAPSRSPGYAPPSGRSSAYQPTSLKSEHIYTDILERFCEDLDDSFDGQLAEETHKSKVNEDGNNEEDKNKENT